MKPEAAPQKLRDPYARKWVVFALVGTGVFMSTLDSSIVNIALPVIMESLQVPLTTVEWVVMGYLLTVSSLLLSAGRLSDIRGRRWVYTRGLSIFTAGSFLCGMAHSAGWLIGARIFQGIGAAMVMACSPALLAETFPVAERGKAMGMIGMVVAAGLTTGPALGGFLLKFYSWRVIFYINIPIGLLVAAFAGTILKGGPADTRSSEKFDWAGMILLTVCFCSLITGLGHIHEWGLGDIRVPLTMGLFLASLAGLGWWEAKTPSPIVDPAILRIRLLSLPILAAMILFMSLFAIVFLMPFYLMHPHGFSAEHAGMFMMIPFVYLSIISPVSGTISDRIGSRTLCTVGMLVLAAALYLLAGLPPQAGALAIAWRLSLAGIGTALFVPPNSSVIMSAVTPQRRGVASGMLATARNLGMVIGVTLAGLIFNTTFRALNHGQDLKVYDPSLAPVFMQSFNRAMLTACGVALVGVLIAFLRGSEQAIIPARQKDPKQSFDQVN